MKAFVTGPGGFIGARLVARLLGGGWQVTALTHVNGNAPTGARLIQGDVTDPARWAGSLEGCDRLFHLAAVISFRAGDRDEMLRINGEGTRNALAAARSAGVARSVVVSSAITAGVSEHADEIRDEESWAPEGQILRNPYMESKLAAEQAALQAAGGGQWVTVVNPTTVFGPGDRTFNSGALIAQIARSRVVPAPAGGTNVVDVDDVVEGIILAGERGASARRYLLCGENMRFREMFAIIARITGTRPLIIPTPHRSRAAAEIIARLAAVILDGRFITPQIVGDMYRFKYFNNQRAASELGWTAKYNFGQSVERAWAYYLEQGLIRL